MPVPRIISGAWNNKGKIALTAGAVAAFALLGPKACDGNPPNPSAPSGQTQSGSAVKVDKADRKNLDTQSQNFYWTGDFPYHESVPDWLKGLEFHIERDNNYCLVSVAEPLTKGKHLWVIPYALDRKVTTFGSEGSSSCDQVMYMTVNDEHITESPTGTQEAYRAGLNDTQKLRLEEILNTIYNHSGDAGN
ncbi:hypothetical protein ACFL1B_05230 [Nanoarchaeota archaeon]